jgi:hypothetical protein
MSEASGGWIIPLGLTQRGELKPRPGEVNVSCDEVRQWVSGKTHDKIERGEGIPYEDTLIFPLTFPTEMVFSGR